MIALVSGKTYPYREQLKKLGCQFENGIWLGLGLSMRELHLITESAKHWPGVRVELKKNNDLFGGKLN